VRWGGRQGRAVADNFLGCCLGRCVSIPLGNILVLTFLLPCRARSASPLSLCSPTTRRTYYCSCSRPPSLTPFQLLLFSQRFVEAAFADTDLTSGDFSSRSTVSRTTVEHPKLSPLPSPVVADAWSTRAHDCTRRRARRLRPNHQRFERLASPPGATSPFGERAFRVPHRRFRHLPTTSSSR